MAHDVSLPDAIRLLGGNGESRKDCLARAAHRAGISFSQAKRIFYGETPDPKASIREKIFRALTNFSRKAEADARAELEELADLDHIIERAIEDDKELRGQITALVLQKLKGSGPTDRPMAGK